MTLLPFFLVLLDFRSHQGFTVALVSELIRTTVTPLVYADHGSEIPTLITQYPHRQFHCFIGSFTGCLVWCDSDISSISGQSRTPYSAELRLLFRLLNFPTSFWSSSFSCSNCVIKITQFSPFSSWASLLPIAGPESTSVPSGTRWSVISSWSSTCVSRASVNRS